MGFHKLYILIFVFSFSFMVQAQPLSCESLFNKPPSWKDGQWLSIPATHLRVENLEDLEGGQFMLLVEAFGHQQWVSAYFLGKESEQLMSHFLQLRYPYPQVDELQQLRLRGYLYWNGKEFEAHISDHSLIRDVELPRQIEATVYAF